MTEYIIKYEGKALSLNDFYAGGHWKKRADGKKKYDNIFKVLLLEARVKWMHEFRLDVVYNSKHDCDNVVGMSKIFVDSMKGIYIKEDSKRYFKGLSITPDTSLKNNTFIFKLTQLA